MYSKSSLLVHNDGYIVYLALVADVAMTYVYHKLRLEALMLLWGV